jgi:hypothetical protein
VKRGETPSEWEEKPAKNRQKDKDARWTKKHGKSFFGYKNHHVRGFRHARSLAPFAKVARSVPFPPNQTLPLR